MWNLQHILVLISYKLLSQRFVSKPHIDSKMPHTPCILLDISSMTERLHNTNTKPTSLHLVTSDTENTCLTQENKESAADTESCSSTSQRCRRLHSHLTCCRGTGCVTAASCVCSSGDEGECPPHGSQSCWAPGGTSEAPAGRSGALRDAGPGGCTVADSHSKPLPPGEERPVGQVVMLPSV